MPFETIKLVHDDPVFVNQRSVSNTVQTNLRASDDLALSMWRELRRKDLDAEPVNMATIVARRIVDAEKEHGQL